MIDFSFTEEQQMIRRAVREFGERELTPRVAQMEEEGKIPDEIIRGMARLGILGMTVSRQWGGAGADPLLAGVVGEELGRADISCATAVFYLVPAAWAHIADKYGLDEMKKQILPELTRGRAFLGIAATEPDAGSDLAGIRTVARKVGDEWVISGEKMFISGVREVAEQLPKAGGFVTLVKTDPAKGVRGMSLFYIPLKTDGISPTYVKDWGRRGISTGGFSLEQVRVPGSFLIGELGRGFHLAMEGFDYARAIISAVCCGAAQTALEQSMEYMKKRVAFGRPIAKFEGIQFRLAEHWAKLDAVRCLAYKALWMLAQEQLGKAKRFDVTRVVAEAKMLAPVFAFEAVNDAIQWFGAFGYTEECPLHIALKGVRSYFWAEGSVEIMKLIVGRELLGKEFAAHK